MKILFMGTPDFAAAVLEELAKSEHEIVGAVSQPDKPKGRGHKLVPTDVKVMAEKYGIAVFQPEKLKDEAFLPCLKELNPDMIVVAAYGKILPDYIIDYPQYGCINVHASILPRYRGAAPIQSAILNGDKTTGVSIMKMDYGLDTGDIVSIEETEIGEYETAGELFARLALIGAKLLVKTVSKIENGEAEYTKQDESLSTYAPKITKETAKIDWNRPAAEISKLICAMNPFPAAFSTYNGEIFKIYDAVVTDGNGESGKIAGLEKNKGLKVYCQKDALYIKTVQFAGSKRMNIEDYARGHEIEEGLVLGI